MSDGGEVPLRQAFAGPSQAPCCLSSHRCQPRWTLVTAPPPATTVQPAASFQRLEQSASIAIGNANTGRWP